MASVKRYAPRVRRASRQASFLSRARALVAVGLGVSGAACAASAPGPAPPSAEDPTPRPVVLTNAASAERAAPADAAPPPALPPSAPPAVATTAPPPLASPRLIAGRHAPSGLTRPPKPVRIAPGFYQCKVDDIYKLRTCKVDRDEAGRTWLDVLAGSLLPMRGLLEEDKGDLVFEGFPTDPEPFGCYRCNDACAEPKSAQCDCTPTQLLGLETCKAQVLRVRFRGGVGSLRGAMTHDIYFQSFDEDRRPKAFDVQINKYNVTIGRRLVEEKVPTLTKRLPGGGVLIGD